MTDMTDPDLASLAATMPFAVHNGVDDAGKLLITTTQVQAVLS